jgi:thymidylate synthase (FAD)
MVAVTPNAAKVIEEAGRTCYLSFDKVSDESAKKFIRMIIKSGHHSVLEHASATFRIKGGSRAFTHQIVRHRLASFSQQSQRYVEETDFRYVTPPAIAQNPQALEIYKKLMNHSQEAYTKLKAIGMRKEDARYVLPNAAVSEIVVSANFREWRHLLGLRKEKAAQWEIREICSEMLRQLAEEVPIVFEDMLG